ncbi:N-acetylglucosamine-binding protein GbpA [Pseudomonas anguilliseptica]
MAICASSVKTANAAQCNGNRKAWKATPASRKTALPMASAGLAQFSPLNEQTVSRWAKRPITAGPTNFTWRFTANHVTRNWRYYITRPDWLANQPLNRAAFEPVPFCVVDGGMQQPPQEVTHNCDIPPREGYQVILGVWEVGDTPMSFYNVMDVMFGDVTTPPDPSAWQAKGMLYPSVDLQVGDQAMTRVFDANGERSDLQTRLQVETSEQGQRNQWTYLLASRINQQQSLLKAGQRGSDGAISPVYGQNSLFARADSGIQRIEVQIDKATAPDHDLLVDGLQPSYRIRNGQLRLEFNVTAVGALQISSYVYDHDGNAKGFAATELANGSQPLSINVENPVPGHHQLVVSGKVAGSEQVLQKTFDMMFVADDGSANYDFTFPDGLRSYTAGTRVLQPKTGQLYQCLPFPKSGYCTQWSAASTQFEPGIGSHWQDAWIAD